MYLEPPLPQPVVTRCLELNSDLVLRHGTQLTYENQDLEENLDVRELAGTGPGWPTPSWLCVPGKEGSQFARVSVETEQGCSDD